MQPGASHGRELKIASMTFGHFAILTWVFLRRWISFYERYRAVVVFWKEKPSGARISFHFAPFYFLCWDREFDVFSYNENCAFEVFSHGRPVNSTCFLMLGIVRLRCFLTVRPWVRRVFLC